MEEKREGNKIVEQDFHWNEIRTKFFCLSFLLLIRLGTVYEGIIFTTFRNESLIVDTRTLLHTRIHTCANYSHHSLTISQEGHAPAPTLMSPFESVYVSTYEIFFACM